MLKSLKIANFGKHSKKKDVKKQLESVNLEGLVDITKSYVQKEAFLEFDSEENQQKAQAALKALNPKWEMKGVPAKKRKPDVYAKRFEEENEETKRLRESRNIADVVTPLAQYVHCVSLHHCNVFFSNLA